MHGLQQGQPGAQAGPCRPHPAGRRRRRRRAWGLQTWWCCASQSPGGCPRPRPLRARCGVRGGGQRRDEWAESDPPLLPSRVASRPRRSCSQATRLQGTPACAAARAGPQATGRYQATNATTSTSPAPPFYSFVVAAAAPSGELHRPPAPHRPPPPPPLHPPSSCSWYCVRVAPLSSGACTSRSVASLRPCC